MLVVGVVHENGCQLLAGDGGIRRKRRGARSADNASTLRPTHRIAVPVIVLHICKRAAAIDLRTALQTIEDRDDHAASGGEIWRKCIGAGAGHELFVADKFHSIVEPVVGAHVAIRQIARWFVRLLRLACKADADILARRDRCALERRISFADNNAAAVGAGEGERIIVARERHAICSSAAEAHHHIANADTEPEGAAATDADSFNAAVKVDTCAGAVCSDVEIAVSKSDLICEPLHRNAAAALQPGCAGAGDRRERNIGTADEAAPEIVQVFADLVLNVFLRIDQEHIHAEIIVWRGRR